MNSLIFFGSVVVVLLLLLAWALRRPGLPARSAKGPWQLGATGGAHVDFLAQVRQALASEDAEFLQRTSVPGLSKRVRRERRRVALKYLRALRRDFESLLRMAKVIAALSPEIGVGQELERLRLTMIFLWRFRMVQLSLYAGYIPLPQMDALSNLISGLSVRLEAAMKQLGERAALAAEMASSADRGRIGLT
ncbi:MAG TPA: hypothetical protein VE263_19260 [Candidatus Angelobacter sp.]|nr:hypothetical protein [Candidatus Angelobacter sp.]